MNVSVVTLAKKTWQEFGDDNVSRLAAALAYYTFTSFFPLLLVLIAIIGIALSFNIGAAEDARTFVINSISGTIPTARDLLAQSIQETEENRWTLGVAGLLTGLWAASNIFAQLEDAFNVIFDVVNKEQEWKDMAITRGRAALMVVLIGVLMIVSLTFSTMLATADELVRTLPRGGIFAWLLNIGISLSIMALMFSALFKFIPDKTVTWKAALIGGVFTSVTWQVGREVLALWFGNSGGVTAGTVIGSVLAFLGLIYYASMILLMGAEVTATYDELVNPDLVCQETDEDSALCSDEGVEHQASITREEYNHQRSGSTSFHSREEEMLILPPTRPHSTEVSSSMRFLTSIMGLFLSLPFILKSLLKVGKNNISKL